jgi:hypothetical protein
MNNQVINIISTAAVVILLVISYLIKSDLSAYLAWAIFVVQTSVQHFFQINLQKNEHKFQVASLSYLSDRITDKNLDFYDEYLREVIEIVQKLYGEWTTKNASVYAASLRDIRYKYIAWILPQQSKKLEEWFEAVLRNIGSSMHLLEYVPVWEKRNSIVEKMHSWLIEIISWGWPKEKHEGMPIHYWDLVESVMREAGINKILDVRSEVLGLHKNKSST